MWLSKIFSGRKDDLDDADEQPSAARPKVIVAPPTPTAPAAPRQAPPNPRLKVAPRESAGFDPYNSGSFQKRGDAWERVTRR